MNSQQKRIAALRAAREELEQAQANLDLAKKAAAGAAADLAIAQADHAEATEKVDRVMDECKSAKDAEPSARWRERSRSDKVDTYDFD